MLTTEEKAVTVQYTDSIRNRTGSYWLESGPLGAGSRTFVRVSHGLVLEI